MKWRAAGIPLAIIVSLTMLGTVSPASAAAPTVGAVGVTLVPADYGTAAADQPLKLVLTLEDTIGAGINAGTAEITVDRSPIATRAGLANWLSGVSKSSVAPTKVRTVSTPIVLGGGSQSIDISVPAKSLKFGTPGVYAIQATVKGNGTTIGSSRSAIAWRTSTANPVPLTIAAPLTIPASSTDFISAKTLATDTAPGGVLTSELNDLANTQVAIGIDPRIIASIRVLGRSAPQSAIDWLIQLESVSNETFPLAWADADLTVALQSGSRRVPIVKPLDYAIDPTQFATPTDTASDGSTSTPTPTPTPTENPNDPSLPTSNDDLMRFNYTIPRVGWPAPDTVTSSDLTKLTASGFSSLILSSSNIKAPKDTMGAAASAGSTSIAISDDILSGYLSDAVQSSSSVAASALTKLTTSLDQLSVESAGNSPPLFVTLPRNWQDDQLQLNRTLAALYSRPWITTGSLANVLATKKVSVKIVDKPQPASRVALVRSMLVSETRERRFSAIVESPEALTSSRRLALLSVLSDEWLDNPTGWNTAAKGFVTGSDAIVNSVQVVDSSDVLFLGASGALPITVGNQYSQPVTVYITVRPRSTLLSIDPKYSSFELKIDANSQRKAQIPVQSISNGKVVVDVSLSSKNGHAVGVTKSINTDVQAAWETVGTLVFGALVVGIFGFGIFRNIRSRRNRRKADGE
ncbi:MAG: hypothetical protein QOF79_1561 [Actinomycetota bacterium]|nr:hypothetical protein [Actinomycetota bacterium]